MEDDDHQNVPKEGISGTQIWVPEVDEDFKPIVGKTTFASVDDAFAFYNRYANAAGFRVRRSSNKYNKEHQEIWKMFVCSKEGKTDDKVVKMYGEVKRRRSVTREECKALMTIKKLDGGPNYVVLRFVEEHNHGLATPRKKHPLRSHRKLSNAQKSLRDSFNKASISASQTMTVMEIESGGFQNIGIIEQDVRNYERDKRKETEGHDTQLLIEPFRQMVEAKGDNNEPLSLRYSDLSYISGILVSESAELKDTYYLCKKGLYDLIKQVQERKMGMEATLETKPKEQLKDSKELVICEPTQARTKGSEKRLISKREKAIKKAINKTKGRRCTGCGLIGPGHDKRNCPALKKDGTNSEIDMHEEQSDDDVESLGDDALHSFDQQENGHDD